MRIWLLRIKAVTLIPILVIIMFLYLCFVMYSFVVRKRLKQISLGTHENTTGGTC